MSVTDEDAASVSPPRAAGGGSATFARRLGHLRRFGIRWGMLLLLAAVWELVAIQVGSPFFPPITEILARTYELWFSGPWQSAFLTDAAFQDLGSSLTRLVSDWVVAVVIGVALGAAIGMLRTFADYVDPIVHFLRAIPPPTLLPLLIVLLGIGDTMKVTLIVVGIVPPILLNTVDGVRSVDDTQLATGRVYGIGRRRTLTHIVIPSAMPKVFAGLRVSMSIALILMVISEMFASIDGIGFSIVQAQRSFRLLDMWTGIVILGALGYLLNALLLGVEGRVLRWHRGARERDA